MDAMDILGGLLRQKSGSSGLGGAILKSIVTGGRSAQPAPPESRPIPQAPAGRPRIIEAPDEVGQSPLDGLEDMLRQAHSRPTTQRPAPQQPQVQRQAPQQPTAPRPTVQQPPSPRPASQYPPHQEQAPTPGSFFPQGRPVENHECSMDRKSELILQAMINAGKADGQIDQEEKKKIVQQILVSCKKLLNWC